MSTEELVKRLRTLVILDEVGSDNPLCRDAADTIDRQAAAINKLTEALRWVRDYAKYAHHQDIINVVTDVMAKVHDHE